MYLEIKDWWFGSLLLLQRSRQKVGSGGGLAGSFTLYNSKELV